MLVSKYSNVTNTTPCTIHVGGKMSCVAKSHDQNVI